LRSGFSQLLRNEIPAYEIISSAAIAFAALLLIIPGFATDLFGFLLIFPFSRRLLLYFFSKKMDSPIRKDFIEGEFEDIEKDDDKKI